MSSLAAGNADPTASRAGSRPSRLPGSDELFRRTAAGAPVGFEAGIRVVESIPDETGSDIARAGVAGPGPAGPEPAADPPAGRRSTGRERHDEKITVYVSSDELIDLEHARLTLKRLGVKADRGRIVREALAELINDLERNGETAVLVRRLRTE